MKHFIVKSPFLIVNDQDRIKPPLSTQDQSLGGLRLAVKDLFHIAGLPTSAGNPTWLASHDIPTQTSSSVTALLAAGAEFCGKTITDELAYSLNGQNIHYGTPENPITSDRLPGGSSSGSAVAVASGLADIGLGTDTGGSIRVPSSYNGLFGLRPTHGVIDSDNMVALAPSFDTVGWMTKDLETLENVAKVLLNKELSENTLSSFKQVLICDNLVEQVAHSHELQKQLDVWRHKGFLTNEASLIIDTQAWKASETFRTLQGAEIWHEHSKWIEEEKPEFAPDIQLRFEWCATISADEITEAKQQRKKFTDWIQGELKDSVLVIPTTPGLSPLFTASADDLATYRNQLMDMTAIAGLTGLPQLHLPVCELDGAPCGLSLIGSKGSDLALIAFAKTLLGAGTNE
ncbi:amidase [Marinomonas ushuaiensis DSM 15871]|uniref:Amidase n=1 Tax=Marinomonas ushuaiensis DSM 15871 TaxID=1122207 RepID=X7E9B2_9GAMM|nr:amidase [Marinomonas ushuaiensis]ETX12405.1 amidase [Marinomonas ushuaiensis DSM 15871]